MTNNLNNSSDAGSGGRNILSHCSAGGTSYESRHARNLIRSLQCRICSKPFRQPVSLPCGEVVCRLCLPAPFVRENISYPRGLNRLNGIHCPFHNDDDTGDHALADCVNDITMTNIADGIRETLTPGESPTVSPTHAISEPITPHISWSPPGGYLRQTFRFAESGNLQYYADMSNDSIDTYLPILHRELDLWDRLANRVRSDLECQICYCLFLEPVTTICGHTFCRHCLNNVLDRSTLCPICRHKLHSSALESSNGVNDRLTHIIACLQPAPFAKRAESEVAEHFDHDRPGIPLFVCAVTFPHLPLFLHIFEPRYRLMLRRVMEDGTRTFGMVLPNKLDQSQGSPGEFRAPFMQYGSLVYVTNVQMFPDGRSLVETMGVSRFKVESWHELDGYIIGRVRRVDDISLGEEESMEASERALGGCVPSNRPRLLSLSTQELFEICLEFVSMMRARSTPWFNQRIIRAYGEPPEDPAIFPFWLATLLPIEDIKKYQLLPTNSVRGRLQLILQWIKVVEESETPRFTITQSCSIV